MTHVLKLETSFGTKEIHFHSKLVGRTIGSRFQMAVNPDKILDANDWMNGETLAHECGHGEDAKRLGWKYIPWVLYHYAKEGYEKSLPERRADDFMYKNLSKFPLLIKCPVCYPNQYIFPNDYR